MRPVSIVEERFDQGPPVGVSGIEPMPRHKYSGAWKSRHRPRSLHLLRDFDNLVTGFLNGLFDLFGRQIVNLYPPSFSSN